jgi:hypothetical protein
MTARRFDRRLLLDAAFEKASCDDLGDPTWQEGLDRVLDDLGSTAQLNEVGATIVETEIVNLLANRLGIMGWRRSHPEVARGTVTQPVVICGQPRTGTTILYDLLALDPTYRAPLTWEVDNPCPPPTTATYETDPRIAESQASLEMADVLIPGFSAFHPMGARLAQECVRITAGDFRSMTFSIQYEIPHYNRWLLHEADMAPAYRWHRAFLQHLQSEHDAERWLLKSPAHLWHLPALMAEYPDSVVIQTHRDPLQVIASISALAAHLRRMASDTSSVASAAVQYSADVFVGLDRSMAARTDGTLPAGQVIDVQFEDFTADPFVVIGGIYDRLGRELTTEVESRMREFLERHPGDGGGAGSRYRFADTGLDPRAMRERALEYQRYFSVPSEEIV